jgi:hypothetical protein
MQIIRTWARVKGTNKVYQVTKQMAEREPPRIGVDMEIISEAEARKLQADAKRLKEQAAIDRRQGAVSKALAQARQKQVQAELEAQERAKYDAAIAAQNEASGTPHASIAKAIENNAAAEDVMLPETPEEVEARLEAAEVAAAGGEAGVIKEDDLGEKTRNQLMAVIDAEELPIVKKGTKAALIVSIRETRKLKAKALADNG